MIHLVGGGVGGDNGIGKRLAMRHPPAVFTSVWFIRTGMSGAGSPGGALLNTIGTNSCAVESVSAITFRLAVSG